MRIATVRAITATAVKMATAWPACHFDGGYDERPTEVECSADGDCDDGDAGAYPGAAGPPSICHGQDTNCDGVHDLGWRIAPVTLVDQALPEFSPYPSWTGSEYVAAWRAQRVGSATMMGLCTGPECSLPSLAWNGSELALAWHSVSSLEAARIAADGSVMGSKVQVGAADPVVSRLVWTGSEYDVFALSGGNIVMGALPLCQ